MFALLTGSVLAGLPARAEQDLPVPTRPPNEILRIPGLPPVELPPGAKVFGPHGPELGGVAPNSPTHPSARGEQPGKELGRKPGADAHKGDEDQAGDAARDKSPPPKLSQEAQRAKILDELFKQLAAADSPDDAKNVAAAIQAVWNRSGSDTADLLTSRAMAAAGAGKTDVALEILDHVVEIAPDWAEGWNRRATVRFLSNDFDGSMADIDRTLALEPRHFGSLGGLATILKRSGLDKEALEVLRRVIALYPQQPDIQKLIDRIAPDVEGRDI